MEIEIKLKIKETEIVMTADEFSKFKDEINRLFTVVNYQFNTGTSVSPYPYYPNPLVTCETK